MPLNVLVRLESKKNDLLWVDVSKVTAVFADDDGLNIHVDGDSQYSFVADDTPENRAKLGCG